MSTPANPYGVGQPGPTNGQPGNRLSGTPIKQPDLLDTLTGSQRDAFAALNDLFKSYGLGTLAPKIASYIKNGYSSDTISILLQDTPEYKERFAGNEERKQKGLPVLSPAQYLSTEASYRQLMQQAGLPSGFYDQPSDFNDFIGRDVSPTELKSRVDLASQATALANPNYKQALQQMFGVDDAHMTAYFLDEDRALPLLQKQAAAAAIGAEALKRGLNVPGAAMDYATSGVSAQQAAQVYGNIAQQLPKFSNIASSYGEDVTQTTFEQAAFGGTSSGQEDAQNELNRLESWNRARATGGVGAAGGRAGLARAGIGQV